MHSCLYQGQLSHRRFAPRPHAFNYGVYYLYLDLDELDRVFKRRWLWSSSRPALAWFRRSDHFGPKEVPLKQAVADVVEQHTGHRPQGPIRLLTHLRYFGYVFNPVSFYYSFDAQDTHVETIVAEVNNTPWGERHIYVLPLQPEDIQARHARFKLDKEFHVSPFMPMAIDYDWSFSAPEQRLGVHMKNYHAGKKIFDASMALQRKPINAMNCTWVLLRYPLMTLKVVVAIYWQALKLLLKGTPVYDHPAEADHAQGGADKAKSL